jgi:HAD superfamily hydrolase (TIGR01509 family)
MNKLIVFDLDGVLVDSKHFHFEALNKALKEVDQKYVISEEEQANIYEGLPTSEKLNTLTLLKGLPLNKYEQVWTTKQRYTSELLESLSTDSDLIEIMQTIKSNGIAIGIASNSIKQTISTCMDKLGIRSFINVVVSNEDVENKKPHPEMYWKAMAKMGAVPNSTVIFEDSIVGKIAARSSNAKLVEVENRADLTLKKVNEAITYLSNSNVWEDKELNVVIPMAGAGSRFAEAGYQFPKPLVNVNDKPMIQAVVESLGIKANYTYIVQAEHVKKYNLLDTLSLITPGCKMIVSDGLTEGAASTLLLAKEHIDNDKPLILANSDQIVEWNSREFIYDMYIKNADGGIATFTSSHPKWSYARTNEAGLVEEVAEKKPISNLATVGIYYWKKGSEFVKYAKQMIDKDIRVNNEFYTCPVFNEAIADGKRVYTHSVKKMWGVGTPEDLESYLRSHSD